MYVDNWVLHVMLWLEPVIGSIYNGSTKAKLRKAGS